MLYGQQSIILPKTVITNIIRFTWTIHVSVEGVPIQVLGTKGETHMLLQLKFFSFHKYNRISYHQIFPVCWSYNAANLEEGEGGGYCLKVPPVPVHFILLK